VTPKYHINLFWSASDEAWVADVPDLKSCTAYGDSPTEALTEAEIAIEAWLDVAKQKGMALPAARYRPAIYAAE
jgi:predicted RNase H-like HicB family nuclease